MLLREYEMYSYNAAGAVTKKRLRIVRSTGTVDKDVTYGYGADGKPTTVLYPGTSVPYTSLVSGYKLNRFNWLA